MKITWKHDTTGLDLKPSWECESAQVHWLDKYTCADGSIISTFVLHIRLTPAQSRKLQQDFPESVRFGMLGLEVLPLIPGQPIWVWKPPRGYENSIKPGTYMAFDITHTPS